MNDVAERKKQTSFDVIIVNLPPNFSENPLNIIANGIMSFKRQSYNHSRIDPIVLLHPEEYYLVERHIVSNNYFIPKEDSVGCYLPIMNSRIYAHRAMPKSVMQISVLPIVDDLTLEKI